MIFGYGAEQTIEEIGPTEYKLTNVAYQDTRWCMALPPCCCCFCWNSIGNSFLQKDITALEKAYAAAAKGNQVAP